MKQQIQDQVQKKNLINEEAITYFFKRIINIYKHNTFLQSLKHYDLSKRTKCNTGDKHLHRVYGRMQELVIGPGSCGGYRIIHYLYRGYLSIEPLGT